MDTPTDRGTLQAIMGHLVIVVEVDRDLMKEGICQSGSSLVLHCWFVRYPSQEIVYGSLEDVDLLGVNLTNAN